MEIKIGDDGISEEEVREIMKERHIFLMGPDGKKQSFEVVTMITVDKKVYVVVAKEGAPKDKNLMMLNVVSVEGQIRFNVVTDFATLKKVNDRINSIVDAMDRDGIIPD